MSGRERVHPLEARIREALSLEPSTPMTDCSITTELSLNSEMFGGLDTLVWPCGALYGQSAQA
jgi:hypothetical protein